MEDARTSGSNRHGGGGGAAAKSHSSGRRRDRRHQSNSIGAEATPDTKSCGPGSGLRALQELVSDTKTARYPAEAAPISPQTQLPLHSQPPPAPPQQSASHLKGDNFEDFMKYLGLAEGSADSLRGRRHHQHRHSTTDRGRIEFNASVADSSVRSSHFQKQEQLGSSGGGSGNGSSRHDHRGGGGGGGGNGSSAATLLPPPSTDDDFSEEENFFQLIGLMLMHAERAGDSGGSSGGAGGSGGCGGAGSSYSARPAQHRWNPEAVVNALRRFSAEFGDCVCRFHRKSSDAFPFYQPEMLRMLDLVNGTFSSIGDAVSSELLLFTEQLRGIHLNMRLFLHPDETLAEVDDAALARLLLAYSEQLDRDLRAAASAVSAADTKYARRRATLLAATVGRYARTAERRRQLVLGRMQSLANAVMAFVSRCPESTGRDGSGGASDGGFRKAVVDLFDDMLACFACLGSSASGGGGGGQRSRAGSPVRNSDEGEGGGAGDSMSATSRPLPPQLTQQQQQQHLLPQPSQPPHHSMLLPVSDAENAAGPVSVASNGDVDGDASNNGDDDCSEFGRRRHCDVECSPGATGSTSSASLEPQEALSLQLLERMESLLSSFLPNERVNTQEFKASFNALYDWWRRTRAGCDRRLSGRMAAIREQFECAQRHRADSSGVKRLCSEAETTWDLMEAAKLMLPPEKRTAALMVAHTAPEWRDSTAALVDSALATLYLYQTAQDASVLSMRLRADLRRLAVRLTDCGPVPLLSLLRVRLVYLRARQYSDLLRAHPQGCLILELAQTHRTLKRDDYADGSGPMSLTVCVPLNDYQKFFQHLKDMRVLSFEARAPVTEKTSMLMKPSCLKKIEKCCQCTIELHPPSGASASSGGEASGAATFGSDDALTMGGSRHKPQLVVGGSRQSFGLVIRPDASHGRANAAMRMICDIVGPASIGDRVKYRSFHLAVSMPHNYRPLSVFADTSRPLTC